MEQSKCRATDLRLKPAEAYEEDYHADYHEP